MECRVKSQYHEKEGKEGGRDRKGERGRKREIGLEKCV